MPRAARSILVAILAALILPTSVLAAKSERHTESFTDLMCFDLHSQAGHAVVTLWANEEGSFAELAYWATPADPKQDAPTLFGSSGAAVVADDGSTIEASIDLYDANPSDPSEEPPVPMPPVGQATLAASLSPLGETDTFRIRDRWGNNNFRITGSLQTYTVTGDLVLPGGVTFDLGSCEATRLSQEFFDNQPAATVSHSGTLRLSCSWSFDDGALFLFAAADEFGTSSTLVIEGEGGFFFGDGPADLSRTGFETHLDLYSGWDSEPNTIGSATASAVLSASERIRVTEVPDGSRFTVKGVLLAVDGTSTVTLNGETSTLPIGSDNCQAADVRFAQLPGRPVHVEPAVNDTPEGAIPIEIGSKLVASTDGTEEAAEVPCTVSDPEGGDHEAPMTHSLWWLIDGTGGPITVDTGNSSFDTLLAVYVADGDTVGTQVGCVDDLEETLQARLTFDSTAGQRYFIQAGGFGGETGDLSLLTE